MLYHFIFIFFKEFYLTHSANVTDFYQMLYHLFSFFPKNTFSPTLELKCAIFKVRKFWILNIFLYTQTDLTYYLGFRPKSSPLQKVAEGVVDRFIFQPVANFYKNNNYCFSKQENIGHHTKKCTKKDLIYSSNTF